MASPANEEHLRLLMRIAAAGDDVAFGELVHALSGRLQRFLVCAGVPHAEAEELVQETWIRVYRSSSRFQSERSITAWIFAIARNLMIDRYRRQRVEVAWNETLDATVCEPASEDDARQLWAFVRESLPPQWFDMLWLYYGEGLTTKELARVLKLTPVNVRVQMHRARRHLAQALRKGEQQ